MDPILTRDLFLIALGGLAMLAGLSIGAFCGDVQRSYLSTRKTATIGQSTRRFRSALSFLKPKS